MIDIRQKVKEEIDQLKERFEKLSSFTEREGFNQLPFEMRFLLSEQKRIMLAYIDILERRIAVCDEVEAYGQHKDME